MSRAQPRGRSDASVDDACRDARLAPPVAFATIGERLGMLKGFLGRDEDEEDDEAEAVEAGAETTEATEAPPEQTEAAEPTPAETPEETGGDEEKDEG